MGAACKDRNNHLILSSSYVSDIALFQLRMIVQMVIWLANSLQRFKVIERVVCLEMANEKRSFLKSQVQFLNCSN